MIDYARLERLPFGIARTNSKIAGFPPNVRVNPAASSIIVARMTGMVSSLKRGAGPDNKSAPDTLW